MTHPHDNIRVGAITFIYSVTKRDWVSDIEGTELIILEQAV
ncbi:TPA: DUF1317 family protein [Escherichia coli]|nr:DUF1317 family protein [Escherichia coli]